ncbi:putative transposase [Streptomyces griseoaurantiacus M045]|uniref:Putative transposase n=1 Tax=Streptomyces griseoaurantiacus M045 TaxID=996637 RepID=F3NSM6_9ACTN|nr:putative transposase [Streptomyces griseoaurantiacus M045]
MCHEACLRDCRHDVWRIFRRSRCSTTRMRSIAKAVLTLKRQR